MVDFTGVKALTIPEGDVVKITSGDTVLWEKITSRLPSEYQEVEYIDCDGNCAIVSDILYNTYYPSGLIVSAKLTWNGASDSEGNSHFCAYYPPVKCFFRLTNGCYGTSQRDGWLNSTVAAPINEIIEIEGRVSYDYNGYLKVNGETILSGLRNYGEINMANAPLYICGYNHSNNFAGTTGWYGKCYWCVVRDTSGNVVGDFVPCYRKSDGEIGLYNMITNTFCTKIGNGSFTKGKNV